MANQILKQFIQKSYLRRFFFVLIKIHRENTSVSIKAYLELNDEKKIINDYTKNNTIADHNSEDLLTEKSALNNKFINKYTQYIYNKKQKFNENPDQKLIEKYLNSEKLNETYAVFTLYLKIKNQEVLSKNNLKEKDFEKEIEI